MLRLLRVKNFYSIRDELELSLQLGAGQPDDHLCVHGVTGDKISRVALLAGHNGSGKTNVLKALAFLNWFMAHSFHSLQPRQPIPFEPHFTAADQASEFELEFEHAGAIWRYRLQLTKERVLHESLYRKEYRFVYIFQRDWDAASEHYKIKLKDEFDLAQAEAEKVRPNCSLLCTAGQYGVALAQSLLERNVRTNLGSSGKRGFDSVQQLLDAADFYQQNQAEHQQMSQMLARWDLGLHEVQIREQEVAEPTSNANQKVQVPFGIHRHQNRDYELHFWQESSGTRSAFVLLSLILPVLNNGGLAVIDEMESDLHPHVLDAVLALFFSPETNPHQAQLIFSSHSHNQMGQLRKEQIVLVEKDSTLNTSAYRLSDVTGVRTDDNFFAKYMAGAYGAVPEI